MIKLINPSCCVHTHVPPLSSRCWGSLALSLWEEVACCNLCGPDVIRGDRVRPHRRSRQDAELCLFRLELCLLGQQEDGQEVCTQWHTRIEKGPSSVCVCVCPDRRPMQHRLCQAGRLAVSSSRRQNRQVLIWISLKWAPTGGPRTLNRPLTG